MTLLSAALRDLWLNRAHALRLAVLPGFLLALHHLWRAAAFDPRNDHLPADDHFADFLLAFLIGLSMLYFALAWHRVSLLGEAARIRPGGEAWRKLAVYATDYVWIATLISIAVLGPMVVILLQLEDPTYFERSRQWEMNAISNGRHLEFTAVRTFLSTILYKIFLPYLLVRLGQAVPARALGTEPIWPIASWRATREIKWNAFAAACVLGLLWAMLGVADAILPMGWTDLIAGQLRLNQFILGGAMVVFEIFVLALGTSILTQSHRMVNAPTRLEVKIS